MKVFLSETRVECYTIAERSSLKELAELPAFITLLLYQ
jgi:hypothetical protein